MELYLSHTSALEHWRRVIDPTPFATYAYDLGDLGDLDARAHRNATRASAQRAGRPDAADLERLLLLGWLSHPVHLCVRDPSSRLRHPDVVCHTSSAKLPPQSFQRVHKGLYAACPELCFVQLAAQLPFVELLEVGYELCGSYRLHREEFAIDPDSAGYDIFEAPALMTPSSLERFLDGAPGLWGAQTARRALPHLLPGSASPMETKLALLLCLPGSLGGYGLPKPQLNHRIDINERSQEATSKAYLRGDLCWPESDLVVEYDSTAFHTGATHIAESAERSNALNDNDKDPFVVTNAQLHSVEKMNVLAKQIAGKLGVRLRTRSKHWPQSQTALREQLLRYDRVPGTPAR